MVTYATVNLRYQLYHIADMSSMCDSFNIV